MALRKTAYAKIVTPCETIPQWGKTRTAATHKAAGNLVEKATEIFGKPFNPDDYLLTHATIVCSVDTESPDNMTLGTNVDYEGQTIKRIYSDFRIKLEHEKYINGNIDAWSRPVLLKSYRSFIGAQNYQEHVQIVSQSKGRIIDAVVRDIGDTLYVDILVATDRKHTDLIQKIESGELNGMSMGCNIQFSICTKCGNVGYDETDLCVHVKYMKGQKFVDEQGIERTIAELCGHGNIDPNGGVTFIEASWVDNPAFKGAVVRNLLTSVNEETIKKAEQVLNSPPNEWVDSERLMYANKKAFDFGDLGGGEDADAGGEAPAEDSPKEEETKDPMDEAADKIKKSIRDRALKELQDEVQKKEKDGEVADSALASTNETLLKEANTTSILPKNAFSSVIHSILKCASNERDFTIRVATFHALVGQAKDPVLYKVALQHRVEDHESPVSYIRACAAYMNRVPSQPEAVFLVRLGQALRQFRHLSKSVTE